MATTMCGGAEIMLPDNVIKMILSHLDTRTHGNARLVDRRFNALLTFDPCWRMDTELVITEAKRKQVGLWHAFFLPRLSRHVRRLWLETWDARMARDLHVMPSVCQLTIAQYRDEAMLRSRWTIAHDDDIGPFGGKCPFGGWEEGEGEDTGDDTDKERRDAAQGNEENGTYKDGLVADEHTEVENAVEDQEEGREDGPEMELFGDLLVTFPNLTSLRILADATDSHLPKTYLPVLLGVWPDLRCLQLPGEQPDPRLDFDPYDPFEDWEENRADDSSSIPASLPMEVHERLGALEVCELEIRGQNEQEMARFLAGRAASRFGAMTGLTLHYADMPAETLRSGLASLPHLETLNLTCDLPLPDDAEPLGHDVLSAVARLSNLTSLMLKYDTIEPVDFCQMCRTADFDLRMLCLVGQRWDFIVDDMLISIAEQPATAGIETLVLSTYNALYDQDALGLTPTYQKCEVTAIGLTAIAQKMPKLKYISMNIGPYPYEEFWPVLAASPYAGSYQVLCLVGSNSTTAEAIFIPSEHSAIAKKVRQKLGESCILIDGCPARMWFYLSGWEKSKLARMPGFKYVYPFLY